MQSSKDAIYEEPPLDEEEVEMALTREVLEKLSQPFPEEAIEWKPQKLYPKDKPTKALAVPYITARHVMDRLDEVVAPAGWQTDFEFIPGLKAVKMMLTVLGVTKSDMGFVEGDDDQAIKGSVSDGLKRAAVLFGVGRYLYYAEEQWVKWDANRRWFAEEPQLKFKNSTLSQPSDAPKEEAPIEPEKKHWIEKDAARKRFWLWTRETLGLTDEQVHEALGVASVKDYEGTMAEAKKQIEEWIEAQMEEETR